MAQDPKYENVQFVSICCDKLDGAREIIEKDDDLRWQNVSHYFMDQHHKEEAKKIFGFKTVPFYVVVDDKGEIHQLGNEKSVDFDDVPGVVRPEVEVMTQRFDSLHFEAEKKEDDVNVPSAPLQIERVFNMDDLDF